MASKAQTPTMSIAYRRSGLCGSGREREVTIADPHPTDVLG